jgi:hypothetical protein
VREDDLLKKLKFSDRNDIGAFTDRCQDELHANVTPVEMQAEFDAQGETVGGLINFLSKKVRETVAV